MCYIVKKIRLFQGNMPKSGIFVVCSTTDKEKRRLSKLRSLVAPRMLHNAVLLRTALQIMERPERNRSIIPRNSQ